MAAKNPAAAVDVSSVYAFGCGQHGQLGVSATVSNPSPHRVSGIDETVDIICAAAGGSHNVVVGRNLQGDKNNKNNNNKNFLTFCWGSEWGPVTPRLVIPIRGIPIKQVACGAVHSVVLTADGLVYEWGLDTNDKTAFSSPRVLREVKIEEMKQQNAGGEDNNNNNEQKSTAASNNINNNNATTTTVSSKPMQQICCGALHTILVDVDGKAYSYGSNAKGQLGVGDNEDRKTPTAVEKLDGKVVIAVAAGGKHTIFVCKTIGGGKQESDTDVYSCGDGSSGQLGNGTNTNIPTLIPQFTDGSIVKVACGDKSSYAIDDRGTLYSWGDNATGQLGQGDTNPRNTPTAVKLSQKVVGVSAGGAYGMSHTVILTEKNQLLAMGSSKFGQSGGTTDQLVPTPVPGWNTNCVVKDIKCGWLHTLIIASERKDVNSLRQAPTNSMGYFYSTPNEIIEIIFSHLAVKELCRLAITNSSMNALASKDKYWIKLFQKEYGQIPKLPAKASYAERTMILNRAFGFVPETTGEKKGGLLYKVGKLIFGQNKVTMFKKECRFIMCGLDAAGKTTMLYKLRLNEIVTTIPTIGFNVETLNYKNISFTVWDVGGPDKIRPLWRHYLQGTSALIWVVDSNDRERVEETSYEMEGVKALLIFANKQDLPNAMCVRELADRMKLFQMIPPSCKWFMQPSCFTSGDGLYEGLEWLGHALEEADKGGSNT